eukprot:538110-Rhodomonas_salina.1
MAKPISIPKLRNKTPGKRLPWTHARTLSRKTTFEAHLHPHLRSHPGPSARRVCRNPASDDAL